MQNGHIIDLYSSIGPILTDEDVNFFNKSFLNHLKTTTMQLDEPTETTTVTEKPAEVVTTTEKPATETTTTVEKPAE